MAMPKGDTVPETRDEILTLDDVAAYLKAGKRTVYRLAQKGEIPAFKLGGTWRFRRSELDRRKHQQEEAGSRSERRPAQPPNHARCQSKGKMPLTTQPLLTPHQSQYFAWLLTRRAAGDSVESLASTLVDAQVDLNPHQVEAALFACRNPLSRGVILADEVGLGKTIEAGLVISQRWAERRRKLLIIVPANLRKQWHQELQDKFGLQGLILEAKSYNAIRKDRSGRTRSCSPPARSSVPTSSRRPRPTTSRA